MNRVNLLLIGVNKAGTSWLHYLLDQHPKVFMADAKELYFFGDEWPSEKQIGTSEAYHRHFPFEASYRYFGEATPMYYRSTEAARDIEAYNSDAKILAIVRDPIQRLQSQFRYHKQLGLLAEGTTLEKALDGRDPRLLRDSHYEETLPIYADRFGSEQFKVVSLEQGRRDPEALWTELRDFLDLSPAPLPSMENRPENPTGSAWFRWVYRNTVRPIRRHMPGVYQKMLESPTVRTLKLALLRLLGTAEREELPVRQQKRLREEFAPTYAYLRDLGFDAYYHDEA